jgi:uncharacterized protein (TIGR02444 family)
VKDSCGEVGSAFWHFSQSIYGAAGVEEECLQLQDKFGVDVNLLLFSAFVGAVHGALVPTEELSNAGAAIAHWQGNVVRSLRTIRRALKQAELPHPAVALAVDSLRKSVKSIELEAERIEQIALEAWCQSRVGSWPRADRSTAVTANIRVLLALSGIASLPENTIAAAQIAARQAMIESKNCGRGS